MTTSFKLQDAVDHVAQSLQLSPVDAAVYVQLCMAGPSKVSDVAASLKVHRNDVYRSLERMSERALVETTLEKPARYVAADPRKVFDSELQGRLQMVEAMRSSRERTRALIADLQKEATEPEHTSYRIIQGRQEISAQRCRMVQEARHEVLTVSTHAPDVVLNEYDGTYDTLLARKDGGPRFRALFSVTPEARPHLDAVLAYPRIEVRAFASERIVRFTLIDDRELLLHVVNDAGRSLYAPDEVALVTTARGLVDAERMFFEQCWREAAPIAPLATPAVRPPVAGRPLTSP